MIPVTSTLDDFTSVQIDFDANKPKLMAVKQLDGKGKWNGFYELFFSSDKNVVQLVLNREQFNQLQEQVKAA